jgi:hypothetical protein
MVADLSVLDSAQVNGWPQFSQSNNQSLHFFLEFLATVHHHPSKIFASKPPSFQNKGVKDAAARCIDFESTTDARSF